MSRATCSSRESWMIGSVTRVAMTRNLGAAPTPAFPVERRRIEHPFRVWKCFTHRQVGWQLARPVHRLSTGEGDPVSFRMRKGRSSFSVSKRGPRASYRMGCLLPLLVILVLVIGR